MSALVLGVLLAFPALAFVLTRRPGIEYLWGEEALTVRAGLSTRRFPYAGTAARLTGEPLGARLFGSAAPGTFTGTHSLRASPSGRVQALATTARPTQALLLEQGGRTYSLTPDHPETHLTRFG